MRLGAVFTAAAVVVTAQALLAQAPTPMKPTAPGSEGDPAWQGMVRLSDGRTFVTDGGLALDAAVARPAKLPEREVPAKVLESYLARPHTVEYGIGDLSAAVSGRTYTAPNGVALNATYVDFLRRALPAGAVRLRFTGDQQPIVIVANGATVGVLMPVKQ